MPYRHVLVPLLHHYNAMCLKILPYPRLSWASHQKPVNACFCQGEIEGPVYDRIFSCRPMLKTRSNQEHDNSNHHPNFTESIEQLVGQIIHSVSVWILSDWECVLHVYLFLAGFFGVDSIFAPALAFCLVNTISNAWSSLYHPFRVIVLLYCPWLVPVS